MPQTVPSKNTANVTYQGTARSRVPQAVLLRSTDGSYYPRMDNRRPRISSYSPSSRSSTTRTPHRPHRPKKIVKSIWISKGGYVAFGNDSKGGRISGKGTIKTSCLDFEKVSYVEELKFNLLSVSQIFLRALHGNKLGEHCLLLLYGGLATNQKFNFSLISHCDARTYFQMVHLSLSNPRITPLTPSMLEVVTALAAEEETNDETEEVNIEEKEASNVKSGETEELDLETTQSTARQGTITPRTLNFEDEADQRFEHPVLIQSNLNSTTNSRYDPKDKVQRDLGRTPKEKEINSSTNKSIGDYR
ncbi:hypothetical protein Tco_1081241 [Tanacetum coccineum]|uniref:Uncharacterized protein n=1 Tax=Tanacetum coccineum TaxID=301880 RepID=A0ABQ5HY52_9ASTR